ncbi:MAG: hypothetical protein P9M03_08980, partial [Candidatus Theseobacter exili]|nr:hypothetical protein [Candidatus Theseobacter exili]
MKKKVISPDQIAKAYGVRDTKRFVRIYNRIEIESKRLSFGFELSGWYDLLLSINEEVVLDAFEGDLSVLSMNNFCLRRIVHNGGGYYYTLKKFRVFIEEVINRIDDNFDLICSTGFPPLLFRRSIILYKLLFNYPTRCPEQIVYDGFKGFETFDVDNEFMKTNLLLYCEPPGMDKDVSYKWFNDSYISSPLLSILSEEEASFLGKINEKLLMFKLDVLKILKDAIFDDFVSFNLWPQFFEKLKKTFNKCELDRLIEIDKKYSGYTFGNNYLKLELLDYYGV